MESKIGVKMLDGYRFEMTDGENVIVGLFDEMSLRREFDETFDEYDGRAAFEKFCNETPVTSYYSVKQIETVNGREFTDDEYRQDDSELAAVVLRFGKALGVDFENAHEIDGDKLDFGGGGDFVAGYWEDEWTNVRVTQGVNVQTMRRDELENTLSEPGIDMD